MITRKQIIAEIKNKLKIYDQQGLLDYISINNWIKEAIKEFGGNIMNEYQTAIIVEKGKAKLPDNFWALKLAVKCEQEGYVEAETEKHIQNRTSYLEWTEINDYYNWLEGKPCLEDGDSKYITETLYFEVPKKAYSFYYKEPTILTLKPHIYQLRCDNDCPNLYTNSEYEISIDENHNYIKTNFNDGFIWVWYRGLPCDNSGDLIIPTTSKDKLKNYIIYFVIVRTLQDLLLSEDEVIGQGIKTKLDVFQPLMNEYFYAAKSESVNKGMAGWSTRLINNNRRNMYKFDFMYKSLDPNRPYGRGFTNRIN